MILGMRAVRSTVTSLVLVLSLSACQSFLPRDETPVTLPPLAAAPGVSSSGQKLDENGYPIIGRMPRAAKPQATDEAVQQTERRYANAGARAPGNPEASYRRDVSELEAIAASQRAEADRVLATSAAPADAAASSRAQ
ncbi:hypothetical protein [Aureimonas sp. Leaf324]|jgi:hypothetical protein|uniref:hypothetical protein n=1 Tax=Aureimonas sp. Leaf324 TaxID=1736336 RepID=UPI000B1B3FC9|nr:hypothetical protein [Aureimonas sp. Leaf324]